MPNLGRDRHPTEDRLNGPAGALVSVIVPCYNQARYLPVAVESVARQTYPNFELVLVNDGSTDDTPLAIERIRASSPFPLKELSQENRGLSMARQAGLDAAEGEWIVFLDADDRLLPAMLETCLRGIERWPEASGVVGGTELIYEDAASGSRTMRSGCNTGWPAVLESNPFGACCSVMLRKERVIAAGGVGLPGMRACEDWDLYARMIRRGMIFRTFPTVVSQYLQHENVLSLDPELMLKSKLAMLAHLAGERADPPIPAEQIGRYCNGYALFAVGLAAGMKAEACTLEKLMNEMRPGEMAFRYFCNEFHYGLQRSISVSGRKLDRDYIDAVCGLVAARLAAHGFARHAGMFASEIRSEMANPMRRFSIRRRISRLLDPVRKWCPVFVR